MLYTTGQFCKWLFFDWLIDFDWLIEFISETCTAAKIAKNTKDPISVA